MRRSCQTASGSKCTTYLMAIAVCSSVAIAACSSPTNPRSSSVFTSSITADDGHKRCRIRIPLQAKYWPNRCCHHQTWGRNLTKNPSRSSVSMRHWANIRTDHILMQASNLVSIGSKRFVLNTKVKLLLIRVMVMEYFVNLLLSFRYFAIEIQSGLELMRPEKLQI